MRPYTYIHIYRFLSHIKFEEISIWKKSMFGDTGDTRKAHTIVKL